MAPSLELQTDPPCSLDCRSLGIEYFPDIFKQIADVAAATKLALEVDEIMEQDLELAADAEMLTKVTTSHFPFSRLSAQLQALRSALQASTIDAAAKERIWGPIAQCYASVRSLLGERIKPLEQRELLREGDVVTAPVSFLQTGRTSFTVGTIILPRFKYVINDGPTNELVLSPHCISSLPSSHILARLNALPHDSERPVRSNFTLELPLKIISAERGMLPLVEIVDGALEQALSNI